jgi:hypothetical protein
MRYFLASWDSEGFECLQDITVYHEDNWEKKELIEILAGRATSSKPNPLMQQLSMMKMRARVNPHRFPEIYAFKADDSITEEQVHAWRDSDPQSLVDWIRDNGIKVVSHRREENQVVIR